MMAIDKKNISHTISPQTHILFVMPRSKKGLGRCHKSGTGNNQDRQRTNLRDNRGFIRKDCHSKSIEISLPVISVSFLLNKLVVNPPQLYSVCQQPFRYPHNSPRDKNSLIAITLTPISMSCRHWLYLSFPHGMIHSLIQLRCPWFVNSNPALHLTQRMSCTRSRRKTQEPRYVLEPETCKYSLILRGYNNWYIAKFNLKK